MQSPAEKYQPEVECSLCGMPTKVCAHCQTCADGTETRLGPASCPECEYWRHEDDAPALTFDDAVRGLGGLPSPIAEAVVTLALIDSRGRRVA